MDGTDRQAIRAWSSVHEPGAWAASARTNRAPGSGAIASLSSGAGPVDAAARDHAAANEDDADRPSNPGGALDAVSENAGAAPRITPTIAMDGGAPLVRPSRG